MEEKQDPVANVGIKQSQKEKIVELIEKSDKYKSINEFVQEAVSNLIVIEDKKQKIPKGESAEKILKSFNIFNMNLLKDELTDLYKLNSDIISFIRRIEEVIDHYEPYKDELTILLTFRNIKNILNSYISYLEEINKRDNLGIPDYKIIEIKHLKDRFIHHITTQEVKG